MNKIEYTLIRSKRKGISLRIKKGGLVVYAPTNYSTKKLEEVIEQCRGWIEEQLGKVTEPPFTEEELAELTEKAKEYLPKRVAHFAALIGVEYGRITIRKQRTRWGSCSSKGNLNFNCLLMLAPEGVIDSVVIHELCHLKEMNHSKAFYELVLKHCPFYHDHCGWLKGQGKTLMMRL